MSDSPIKLRVITEKSCLGYIVYDPSIFDSMRIILGDNPEVFTDPQHQDIYRAMLTCREVGRPLDGINILNAMKEPHATYVASLTNYELTKSPYHAPQRAKEVADWYRADLVSKIASAAILDASTGKLDNERLAEMMSELAKITQRNTPTGIESIGEILPRVIKDIENRRKETNTFIGVPTGMPDYDRILNGLRPETMNVIAARPGVGKSALAVNIARNASRLGHPVLFFSLEMPADQLSRRFVSIESETPYSVLAGKDDILASNLKLQAVAGSLSGAKISFCDSGNLDFNLFQAMCRRFAALNQGPMPVIILDYLQQCKMHDMGRKNRYEVVGEFTRNTKQLARELGCPIVLLSQLSREADDAVEPFRCNQFLRESGNIEQDSDTITIMLSNMEAKMWDPYKEMGYRLGEVLNCAVTKNREGRTGRCNMYFEKSTQFIVPVNDHQRPYHDTEEDYLI